MFSSSKNKRTKDGEGLDNPTSLTNYFMDTFMCTDYHLKSQICMDEYE